MASQLLVILSRSILSDLRRSTPAIAISGPALRLAGGEGAADRVAVNEALLAARCTA
jgi:hypothetical protein